MNQLFIEKAQLQAKILACIIEVLDMEHFSEEQKTFTIRLLTRWSETDEVMNRSRMCNLNPKNVSLKEAHAALLQAEAAWNEREKETTSQAVETK